MYLPRVSVIVPARNEEKNIVAALRSLDALKYDNLEIIVIDDLSTDRTAALAEDYIRTRTGSAPMRLLTAPSDPPEGWVGKTFAVDYAITRSSGDTILVCDADVTHTPQSLRAVVEYFQAHHLDLLSLLPHFDVRSWGEYPMLFQTFLLYASSRVARALGSRQSFGMGTYFMFTRDFYNRSGGWSAHREHPESLPVINYCVRHGGAFAFVRDRATITARVQEGAVGTFLGLVRVSNFVLLPWAPLAVFIAYVAAFTFALGHALVGSLWGASVVFVLTGFFTAHLAYSRYRPHIVIGASALFLLMPLYMLLVSLAVIIRLLFDIRVEWRGRYLHHQ